MDREVVKTIPEKCVQCYACIRNCPVKAVAIRKGKAQIIQERCIHCGNCVKICARQAKEVIDGVGPALALLASEETAAVLAPSFPAVFELKSHKLPAALRAAGFSQVWEAAAGAELVVRACRDLGVRMDRPAISPFCPGIVNIIERHYPEFIPNLLPLASPAVATARLIRSLHPDKSLKIIFIGPCIAKKGEIMHPSVLGDINEVLTFAELQRLLDHKGIDFEGLEPAAFDSPRAGLGYAFPLSGGLLRNLKQSSDPMREDYPIVEGFRNFQDTLELLGKTDHGVKLVDSLFCSGCISGPGIAQTGNLLKRKASVLRYIEEVPQETRAADRISLLDTNLYMGRSFRDIKGFLPQPAEADILRILSQTHKDKEEDQLNCGACGYASCREKAAAVYQGIAEQEMCLPYLLSEKSALIQSVNEELSRVRELKEDLDTIIDGSYDGICMTDGQGNILRINKNLHKLLGLREEEIVHQNMALLEQQRVLHPSVTMMVIKEKKAVTILQRLKSGKQVLATGSPVLDREGRVVKVISNIRDFDQLQKVKAELDSVYQKAGAAARASHRSAQLIALSESFARVLDMCKRVALVDTTVLILGESGSGKEVAACYIHNNSPRKDGPFIKINCGALPETLIESELFGYETGAFTGARSSGKAGLFEMASEGTLFLDEIGELPLSQQVKLLQVIQDKQVTRVGGTKPKKVNVRLITATNRDLARMVQEGAFRADLYYRLNVVPIRIPPLRERQDDIIPLMYYFLELFNQRYQKTCRITRPAREALTRYPWPGNVRELENLMERLVVIAEGDTIDLGDLPSNVAAQAAQTAAPEDGLEKILNEVGVVPLKEAMEAVERRLILKARDLYKNTYKMAEALGINQSTAVRKLNKYLEQDEAGEA